MNPDQLKALYELKTSKRWTSGAGIRWLNGNLDKLEINCPSTYIKRSAFITLSDKASLLVQHPCVACEPLPPVHLISFRLPPQSGQSLSGKKKQAFNAAVRGRLTGETPISTSTGKICLRMVFVCSERRRVKDLDNMAKLFMDSVKGIIMGDDKDVDHLDIIRLTHNAAEEFVWIRIATSDINDKFNVVVPELQHSWAGAEPIDISEYLD